MTNTLKRSLSFLSGTERLKFSVLLALRALVSVFDLLGLLAIGFIASSLAISFTAEGETQSVVQISTLSIPAINLDDLPLIVALTLILFVIKAIASIYFTRNLAVFLARIEVRAANQITRQAFGGGIEWARMNSREEIVFAVQVGSPSAFNLTLNSLGTVVAEGFLFLIVLAIFAIVDPIIALSVVLFFGIMVLLIQQVIGRIMSRTGEIIAESTLQANTGLYDLGEVFREASILGRKEYFFNQIYSARLKASGTSASQYVLAATPRYIVETALILGISVFVLLQIGSGDISSSAATLGIFLTGALRLTASLLPLQSALLIMKQAAAGSAIALELLPPRGTETEPKKQYSRPKPDSHSPASVSLNDVCFSYQGNINESLSNISITIKPGTQVAFIGASGSGKSTLADVILGLLTPTQGSVEVNGESSETLIAYQPGLLGYVPQRPGMISGSIAENVALGVAREEIDVMRLEKALHDSNLSDLIQSLPNGWDTDVGKRKDELSGGQLQRIGLARALYTQPKLLVMDEATSALDAASENEINLALDKMRGNVTVILIAHRLNTIQRSDEVYFLEAGRVSASGTFKELVRSNEKVRNLANLMAIDRE
jgi:ATP-binding cassette subfamily C protein